MERPQTRFGWNGEVSLAYQVVGDGPVDLLNMQGYVSQVDLSWESPHLSSRTRRSSGCSGGARRAGRSHC